MRRSILLVLVLLSGSALVGRGETAPGPAEPAVLRLTLAETLARAQAQSARLGQLDSRRLAADAVARGARAARMPQVDLAASYARNANVPELILATPGAPPRTIFPNIPDNYRGHAGLTLPIFTSGRISSGITSAEAQRAAAQKDRAAGLADVLLEAASAYWNLVDARESARVLAEAIASFEAHLKDARNREDLGMAARSEVLAVQVERDRAELSRLRAANEARVSNANLLRLLDLPLRTEVEPVPNPNDDPPSPADMEALVAGAAEARPEIAALKSHVAALDAAAKAQRATSLPQAGLSAGYDYANPNPRILPLSAQWKGTWSIGVNVSIIAFDGGRTGAAVAQARAEADAERKALEELERRVRLEVTTRFLDLETARAAIPVAERSLEAAKENVQVSQDRYREGVIPSSELLDAETGLLRAGLDRTAATTAFEVARAGLDRAAGN
jgi:outer membrane protein